MAMKKPPAHPLKTRQEYSQDPRPRRTRRTLELADLAGTEWDGFRIALGLLHHPYWRRPFEAAELRQMFYRVQLVTILEHDKARLLRELEAAETALQAAEDRADYYRRQLALESRAGMMLAALQA